MSLLSTGCAIASFQLFRKFTTVFVECDIIGKKCKYIRFIMADEGHICCVARCIFCVNNFEFHLLNHCVCSWQKPLSI